jgi:hypothetical protein
VPVPFVRRKTGIWHKHRRIAASEGALLALMSLYAPFIQQGHTHSAQIISLPLLAEHHTPRTVLGLRDFARNGRRDMSEPRDDTKTDATAKASDVALPSHHVAAGAPPTRWIFSNTRFH